MNSDILKSRYGWLIILACLALLAGLIIFALHLGSGDPEADAALKTAEPSATSAPPAAVAATAPVDNGEMSESPIARDVTEPAPTDCDLPPLTEPRFPGLPYGRYPDDTPLERVKRLIAPREAPPAGRPHLIRVFLDKQVVAVYTENRCGQFTVPVHYFPCSTGIEEDSTPTGNYTIGIKYPLGVMIDMSYSRYLSQITGHIYFHSMPSYDNEYADVPYEDFNLLGVKPYSHGCIRMAERDCKWIHDYLPEGTPIEVLESSENYPDVPDEIDVIRMPADGPTWDPTNEDPENPYQKDPDLLLPQPDATTTQP